MRRTATVHTKPRLPIHFSLQITTDEYFVGLHTGGAGTSRTVTRSRRRPGKTQFISIRQVSPTRIRGHTTPPPPPLLLAVLLLPITGALGNLLIKN